MVTLQEMGLIAVGGLFGILFVRFIIAYLNTPERSDSRLTDALQRTGTWVGIVVGGFAGAVGMGLVNFGDIIAEVTGFIGGHPFAVSNVGAIGLGALTLSGVTGLTTAQYVGIALLLVGGSMLLSEVYDRA